MKYFLDTEFIEGFHKPLFGKRRHFIDLISIGIVCEDGRKYHAVSNAYRYSDASDWVKDNVINPMYRSMVHGDNRNRYSASTFNHACGSTDKHIANEIKLFIQMCQEGNRQHIEFYGYYSDYDWVLFCSLFGTMMDLPEGFPMFCIDLKQELDNRISRSEIRAIGYDAAVGRIKNHAEYPQQQDEHNALSDAIWNKKLYDFIKQLSPCHLLS